IRHPEDLLGKIALRNQSRLAFYPVVKLGPHRYFFFPPPLPRGLPASLRFARQVPSWLRDRGCLPPPSSGTYGPLPARRSATGAPPAQPTIGCPSDRTPGV